MSSATETCSCGAKIELAGHGSDVTVSRALISWRETHRHSEPATHKVAPSEPVEDRPEHLPSGNNFASTERRSNFLEPDELNQQFRPGPYGRSISLKWWPSDGRD